MAIRLKPRPKHRRLLGQAIRHFRHEAGFTQEKLAEKADLSVVFISDLENGKETVSVDGLHRIAKALKIGLVDLVEKIP